MCVWVRPALPTARVFFFRDRHGEDFSSNRRSREAQTDRAVVRRTSSIHLVEQKPPANLARSSASEPPAISQAHNGLNVPTTWRKVERNRFRRLKVTLARRDFADGVLTAGVSKSPRRSVPDSLEASAHLGSMPNFPPPARWRAAGGCAAALQLFTASRSSRRHPDYPRWCWVGWCAFEHT